MTTAPIIGVHRLPHADGLELPAYASAGAPGADLRAAVSEDLTIPPLGRALVPSGLVFDIPEGFEIQVRPRSGLAARHGITVLNAPGTVDSDYRGEVMAILVNLGSEPFTVTRGERIAQLVVAPAPQARFADVESVKETARGAGGFGSTGRA